MDVFKGRKCGDCSYIYPADLQWNVCPLCDSRLRMTVNKPNTTAAEVFEVWLHRRSNDEVKGLEAAYGEGAV